ncbi:phosphoglycerate dehydrogenase [Marivirga sp. S37H4]|uniref:D-3-phosphoglycerate dehydrogenase n=1 Tax=Marivirga aurantiaca TaxID=2802615 RepID=A0A934WWK0_9BACT|nr:phosphoglycerate dehydrogenase [Marivirga aurantiaca]MBK6264196.1 phosphoglycerate dehydrogenase [Marivirga aurantiaca]
MDKYFIIDFDSTLTRVEAMDLLASISLEGKPQKEEAESKIKELTDLGMNGEISFRDSLKDRLLLLEANKSHLPQLITALKDQVSISFKRNTAFFNEYSDKIYVISNGFREYIEPIVTSLGVLPDHIFANELIFDEKGNIKGFDENNPLSKDGGKAAIIRSLDLDGDIYVIGDGHNDYEIKAAGLANKFYAFTENISREKVMEKADHIAPSLDEVLFENKINSAISYPKNRIKVLLLENVHPIGVSLLEKEGFSVEVYPAGLDEDELCEKIKGISILGLRSKTQLSRKVIESADRLMAVGAFCIGTNQIDLDACQERGVAVFNAPFSNTRSVVELAIGSIIMLIRNIFDKSVLMHHGKWDKSASGSKEIRGKKLGLIGYGNIGAQLSVLAESIGMDVYYYDTEEKLALGNATKLDSLEELLAEADVVSLHVDGRIENTNIIGKREFDLMKEGVIFLNLSRGHVVDITALKEAITSKKVAGSAVDVFPVEPKSNNDPFENELRGLPNIILTPHIGGSTEEAQVNIGQFVPARIMDYINTGTTTNSVNFPNLQLPRLQNAHRLIHIHKNVPGIIAKINQLFAEHEINIVGQYLKTNEKIGYVITDIDKAYSKDLIKALRAIDHTIKFRVLY